MLKDPLGCTGVGVHWETLSVLPRSSRGPLGVRVARSGAAVPKCPDCTCGPPRRRNRIRCVHLDTNDCNSGAYLSHGERASTNNQLCTAAETHFFALWRAKLVNLPSKGGKKIALQGGGWLGSPFAQPPLPLLGRRAGRGVWAGAALPAVPGGGGGGVDPNIHASK